MFLLSKKKLIKKKLSKNYDIIYFMPVNVLNDIVLVFHNGF